MGIQKEPAMSVFSRAAILILLVGHLCYADEEFTDIADKEFDGLRNWNGRKTKQLDDGPILLQNLQNIYGIGVEDWVLVRHVSSSAGTWYPAVDHLTGTEKYGNPSDPKSTFSIAFKTMQYSRVLLTLGDFSKWMLFDKSELDKCTTFGTSSGIKVRASSANGAPHKNTGTLLCRTDQSEDPWIYLTGKSGNSDIVYGGKSYSGSHAAHLSSHGGASVYIRTTSPASVPENLWLTSVDSDPGLAKSNDYTAYQVGVHGSCRSLRHFKSSTKCVSNRTLAKSPYLKRHFSNQLYSSACSKTQIVYPNLLQVATIFGRRCTWGSIFADTWKKEFRPKCLVIKDTRCKAGHCQSKSDVRFDQMCHTVVNEGAFTSEVACFALKDWLLKMQSGDKTDLKLPSNGHGETCTNELLGHIDNTYVFTSQQEVMKGIAQLVGDFVTDHGQEKLCQEVASVE